MRRRLLLSTILLLTLSLYFVPTTQAQEVVTTVGELNDAVLASQNCGNNEFSINLTAGIFLLTTPLSFINCHVILRGQGIDQTVITAGGDYYYLSMVAGGTLEIHNLTIQNVGIDTEYYSLSAITIDNSSLIIESSKLDNLTTDSGGGAIVFNASTNHTLTINRSLFNNNNGITDAYHYGAGGGAIQTRGGLGVTGSNVIINCTRFDNNIARWGGAIDHRASIPMTITRSSFLNNITVAVGAGTDILSNSGLPIPAEHNWWDGLTPISETQNPDYYNISANVDADPALLQANGEVDPTALYTPLIDGATPQELNAIYNSGEDCAMRRPESIPGNRDVLPEAETLHENWREFGLPLPIVRLPVEVNPVSIQGYGSNTYSRTHQSSYNQTHGIHTGIDYGTGNVPVAAVCDGLILRGRVSGNGGGSTQPNNGLGITLRCFADPVDPDADGFRNLSNIVVVYNHLDDDNYAVAPGDVVALNQPLGQTAPFKYCQSSDDQTDDCTITNNGFTCVDTAGIDECSFTYDHLHFEIFIARGFRSNAAIRINPIYMFQSSVALQHNAELEPYYPFRDVLSRIPGDPVQSDPSNLWEVQPFDGDDNDDRDYGIQPSQIGLTSLMGDIVGSDGTFWSRRIDSVDGIQVFDSEGPEWVGPEWTPNSLTTVTESPSLIDYLFVNGYPDGSQYIGPNCPSAPVSSNISDIESCSPDGSVPNDDAG